MRKAYLETSPITDEENCYILVVTGGYLDIEGEVTERDWLAREFSYNEFGKQEARDFARKYGYEPNF
ncbi:MAG: hypothetical protein ABIA11_02250 [Patescibacteria group bacterium]